MDLAAVIAQVETRTRDHSLRFEPTLYARWSEGPLTAEQRRVLGRIMAVHDCVYAAACMIACTSWGRYQLLGENIYSVCQCNADIFVFVTQPGVQLLCFQRFLAARGIAFSIEEILMDRTKREQFIARYNGPGDIDVYWAQMQVAIKELGGPTIVGEGSAV